MQAGFPTHPAAVEPAWLTAKLRSAGVLDGDKIIAIAWTPIGAGQVGDSARLTLEYDHPGAGPRTIAGKFPAADLTSRATAGAFALYAKEVAFYRELRGHVGIRTPAPLVAEIAGNCVDFILLLEDLGPARGGDQLAGCGPDDAREAIRQAARLHGPSWGNSAITDKPWLQAAPEAREMLRTAYPLAFKAFEARYADHFEPELMAICAGLAARADAWFSRRTATPCLVHGDFRLDNMLFDINGGAEPMGVLDWQTVQAGNALTDVGYFLGAGIGSTLRRAMEDELLELYCEQMARYGVRLSRTALWDDYRRGALHGLSTAVFSAANVERTARGDEVFLSMARGAAQLALDHDSLGAL